MPARDTASRQRRTPEDSDAVVRAGEHSLATEQAAADMDQTVSDADQTASDSDQTASDRDQAQAEADQRTSNRDQAAADRERDAPPPADGVNKEYDASRVERLEGTLERAQTGRARAQTSADRHEHAESRDANARLRDISADARDRADERSDNAGWWLGQDPGLPRASSETARENAAAVRVRGAADRAAAAEDRAAATHDREHSRDELRRAQIDPLTGAFGRELGEVALEREIDRARHGNGRLMLAFVDVDGLKQVNDGQGHAAGDVLLKDAVAAIQAQLRSYDPIVRVGGDEFVCALGDSLPADAHRRFQKVRDTMKQSHPAASISVGFATLRPEDNLAQLTLRGDAALYEAKHTR